jgi:hypothetical protein
VEIFFPFFQKRKPKKGSSTVPAVISLPPSIMGAKPDNRGGCCILLQMFFKCGLAIFGLISAFGSIAEVACVGSETYDNSTCLFLPVIAW